MNLKKKITFYVLFIILLISITNITAYYFIYFKYTHIKINGKYVNKQKYSIESVNIYNKYLKRLHHLRDPYLFKESELLFNSIGEGKMVLLQGDSWVERFSESTDAKKAFKKYSDLHNIKFVMAGTSSYSPSLYQAQLQILKSDYKINPDVLITFFDQTDIGDELCRYKSNRYTEDENIFVKSYANYNEGRLYFMDFYLDRIKILTSKKLSLLKLILLTKSNVIEKYFTTFTKTCGFDKIMKPLYEGLDTKDYEYFAEIVNDYFNYIFTKTDITKMIIVTHPHLKNLTGDYKINIKSVLKEIVNKSKFKKNIIFHNFNNEHVLRYLEEKKNKKFLCIFVPGDEASHLCDVYQYKVIVPSILRRLNQ